MNPAYLLLGEILRPHGIRGELRVRMLTDYPERIAKLETIYLADKPEPQNAKPYKVQGMRMNGDFGLLKLHEIADRTAGGSTVAGCTCWSIWNTPFRWKKVSSTSTS